jgi:multimeric flavodoxin WrbA
MNVLVLQGSPNKSGNTATLANALLDGIRACGEHTIHEFWLNDMQIRPCQACYQCFKTGRCVTEDDMQRLYPEFEPADLVVFAVPITWWHMNAQTKLCIDRMTALLTKKDGLPALAGKQIVLVTAYNYHYCAECTIKMFQDFQEWIGVRLEILEHCAKEGHVQWHSAKLQAARQLGTKLASELV